MIFQDPNYTQQPNLVVDYWIKKLSASAGIVLVIFCRKIFGWHKTSDSISINQLCKTSGFSKNTILKAISQLEEHGLIVKYHHKSEYGWQPNSYSLALEKPIDDLYSEVSNQDVQRGSAEIEQGGGKKIGEVVQNMNKGVVQNLHLQKKDLTKEIKKEIYKERLVPPSLPLCKGGASPPSTPLCVSSSKKTTKKAKKEKNPFKNKVLVERLSGYKRQKEFSKFFERPLVGITDEQHQELIDELTEETLLEVYKSYADWLFEKAASDPDIIKKYTDYGRLKEWGIKRYKNQSTSELAVEDVKTYVDKIIKETQKIANKREIEVYAREDRVEIYSIAAQGNRTSTVIMYTEKGFKGQLDSALRKWGVK